MKSPKEISITFILSSLFLNINSGEKMTAIYVKITISQVSSTSTTSFTEFYYRQWFTKTIEFLCFFHDFTITISTALLHICPVLSRYTMNPTITNAAANHPKTNKIHKSSLVIDFHLRRNIPNNNINPFEIFQQELKVEQSMISMVLLYIRFRLEYIEDKNTYQCK